METSTHAIIVSSQVRNSGISLKPRPHQQQCRSNIVERYTSNDSFYKMECCFNNFEQKFRPFDETNRTCSISFDFVEKTKCHEKIM